MKEPGRKEYGFMKRYFISFILPIILVFGLVGCHNSDKQKEATPNQREEEVADNTTESVYPPTVMVRGELYQDTGYINSEMKCGMADGIISSYVRPNQLPTKNDEANFGEELEYQYWGENYLNILIRNKYYLFEKVDAKSKEMPSAVANFKAMVTEVREDGLLVSITEMEDGFSWIFSHKSPNEIKPVHLNDMQNLILPHKKAVDEGDLANLAGKRVQVWFDGSAAHIDAESSVPITLGVIYRITIIEE